MIVMENSQLRAWAYNPESFINVGQDFELGIANLHHADIILQCASDNNCPKQYFFLNCAYLLIGSAVRMSFFNESENEILAFIRRAEKTGNEHLLEFVWRARDLIEDPSRFDYDEWCAGGLAYKLYYG